MIGQGLGRVAFAERLSIPQLEEALANRTIPAYIGVPLLEEKVQMKERMMAARSMAPPPQMTIEEEILARANQAEQGIDEIPVEMPEYESPEYATGGIVALSGGDVIRAYNGLPEEMYEDRPPMRGIFPSIRDYFQGGIYNDLEQLKRLGYTDVQISQMTPQQRAEVARVTRSYTPEPTPVAPDEGIAPALTPTNVAATTEQPTAPPPDTGIAPPETPPAAPIAAPQVSVPGLIGRAEQLYGALYGDQKPETPKEKSEYLNQAQEFFTQAGVDLNLASKQAEEIARQKADLEGDRREAKKFGVISAGLAILAGDPASSAIENIGKGLGKGMEKYTSAINDIKKTEREMQALERSLAVAQNQSRMGLATVAAGDYREAQKRYDDLNKEMRTGKADLLKALMSDDRARQVVEAQMRSKPSTFSEQLDALVSGGMSKSDATKLILGATKTGELTPALLEKQFNGLSPIQRMQYKKIGINTPQEYTAWRLAGNEPLESRVGGPAAPGAASNDPLGLRTP